jgi:hypothetical protein
MSSVVRSLGSTQQGLTRFVKPESPCYIFEIINPGEGEIILQRLFPFSFTSGVLDITYAGNNFKSVMVDVTGEAPLDETDTAVRIIGGPRLVTSLGDNFKAYIRAWRDSTIDAGSPITLEIPCHVVRVQEGDLNSVSADSGDSYLISDNLPAGDNYISGNSTNSYNATYIFKTPLTFSIVESGVKKYITFRSIMDQE